MGVKDAAWDNQWRDDAHYLDWLRVHLREMRRVLKTNGSLYLFASPRMAARVEVAVGEYFNVLNQVVWSKPFSRHNGADTDAVRGYFPQTERIIFAEQGNSDVWADTIAGFTQAETKLKAQIFGVLIREAMDATNTSTHELTEAVGAYREHNHGGAASNWLAGYNIPTPEQYQRMRVFFNAKANSTEFLRREYEDLRREYEDLRREYEDLRRPFNSSPYAPYTDVWTFRTVQAYEGKHECEKPLDLMRHIVSMSSRPGDVVLDCFAGSGATLDAARQEGRSYIGCDQDAHWVNYARNRMSLPYMLPLFAAVGE